MERAAEEILRDVLYEAPRDEGLPLAAGRRLDLSADGSRLVVSNPDGEVELRVEITAAGPVLRFTGAALALEADGEVSLDCERLSLRSRGAMRLESGDFEQRVAGDRRVSVRDDAHFSAQALDVTAKTGDLALRANDDVALNGLRVLMNVPTPEEIEAAKRAARTFEDFLALPDDVVTGSGRMPPSKPRKLSDW